MSECEDIPADEPEETRPQLMGLQCSVTDMGEGRIEIRAEFSTENTDDTISLTIVTGRLREDVLRKKLGRCVERLLEAAS